MSVFVCIYQCIDRFPDGFSAVLVAEVIQHFFPKFVDLSILTVPFNSREEKLRNWSLLNRQDKTLIVLLLVSFLL